MRHIRVFPVHLSANKIAIWFPSFFSAFSFSTVFCLQRPEPQGKHKRHWDVRETLVRKLEKKKRLKRNKFWTKKGATGVHIKRGLFVLKFMCPGCLSEDVKHLISLLHFYNDNRNILQLPCTSWSFTTFYFEIEFRNLQHNTRMSLPHVSTNNKTLIQAPSNVEHLLPLIFIQ